MDEKESIIKKVTPLAVLKALTEEARHSTIHNCLGSELIGIWHYPFRIGRESRVQTIDGKIVPSERQKVSIGKPNNDIYLVDRGRFLQISRQHLQIDKTQNGYSVTDRGSACGTIINAEKIGGEDRGGTHELKDGDIIKIGAEDSFYLFQFMTLV